MVTATASEQIRAHRQDTEEDIIIKRRGGGTLIDSRPVFSFDAKYIYFNCGWGVRVFSVKTGECVQSYDANCKEESVVSIFLHEGQPSALTSNGRFTSWEAKSGKALKKHTLQLEPGYIVTNCFITPKLENPDYSDLCVTSFDENKCNLILQFFDPANGEDILHPLNNVTISDINTKHNVSFGGPEEDKIIASISSENLNIYSLNGNESKLGIKPGLRRKWICVRVSPNDYPVAAGDDTGRVVLFRNPFEKGGQKPQAVYHWHTLPCRDIAITPSSSLMYTGGGENVLVKWNLANPQIRNFLPRLSAEIIFIEISNNLQHVAIVTRDNSIKVVDGQSKLVCVLQELTWGVLSIPGTKLFPAGIAFEPRSRTVVLNGRPGHLHFYSPHSESLIFSVDVTFQNYLTQERHKVIYNTEVTAACVTTDGAWMATLETREDPSVRLEQRLKMWHFNLDNKNFQLNTSVEMPHNGKAKCLRFRPGSSKLSTSNNSSLEYLLISTGNDNKFRIWTPNDIDSVYRKGVVWGCENACFYRGKGCGPVSFSEDGTIVGVGFEAVLVLWDLTELKVSASLTSPTNNSSPFKIVEFGRSEGFCEVIAASDVELLVWNLMTLKLCWRISMHTSLLIQDSMSMHFAVFSTDNEVLIFSPKSSQPVYKKTEVCERKGEIISATFVPRKRHLSDVAPWVQSSQLFYIDSNQELISFECKSESVEGSSLAISEDSEPMTRFGSLLAAQTNDERTEVKPLKQNIGYGVLGAAAVSQLLKYPAHTMPQIRLICNSFIQSLVTTDKSTKEEKMDVDDESGLEEDAGSSSSEDEDIIRTPTKAKSPVTQHPADKNELALFFKDLGEDTDGLQIFEKRKENFFFIDG